MKVIGDTREIIFMVQEILTVYLGSPRKKMPPTVETSLSLEEERPAGVTHHSRGIKLPKAKARLFSLLLPCNKLMSDSWSESLLFSVQWWPLEKGKLQAERGLIEEFGCDSSNQ